MKCISCGDLLIDYGGSNGQSLQCISCKLIFNAEYMRAFNMKDVDNVNHPPHYNSSPAQCDCGRRIECIDITRHMNFNIGNAVKYLWRFAHKNGIEDLKKARWYLDDQIKQMEGESGTD